MIACGGDDDAIAPQTGLDGAAGDDASIPTPSTGPDAASPSDGGTDATPTDAATCDRSKPFSTPRLLGGDAGAEFPGRLTPDGKILAFVSLTNQGFQIELATRTGVDEYNGASTPNGIAGNGSDTEPTFGDDGTFLVFASTRTPNPGLWSAALGDAGWMPSPIVIPNGTATDREPTLVKNGAVLYYANAGQLRVAKRIQGHTYGSSTLVPGSPNTDGGIEGEPTLTEDETILYFKRAPNASPGSADIYRATRSSATEPFGEATKVVELSSDLNDLPAWVSPDDCTFLLSRPRDATYALYVAHRGD